MSEKARMRQEARKFFSNLLKKKKNAIVLLASQEAEKRNFNESEKEMFMLEVEALLTGVWYVFF